MRHIKNKMIYLNPKWVIIILNMNGQNIIIKNHEFSNRIKKQDSYVVYSNVHKEMESK